MSGAVLQSRLEPLRARLPAPALEALGKWIECVPEEALYRMSPLEWATKNAVDEQTAIEVFLRATKAGVLDFEWGVLCSTCGNFMHNEVGLRNLSASHMCGVCRIATGGDISDDVEVAFTVNRAIRRIRYHDEPGAFPYGDHHKRPYFSSRRLIASQTFRDLFRAESIPSDLGIQVRSLSLLFTDLKGSTQLYERIGDLRAFELVRRHFDVLREIVVENGGAVVKTIGDAVMATFHAPEPAMAAGLAMHDRIASIGNGELLLKIGVHDGPCIAVELNERLDYFGQTVNIAARVQALADAGEIVVTESFFGAPGVQTRIAAAKLDARHSREPLKGIDAPVPVVRLA